MNEGMILTFTFALLFGPLFSFFENKFKKEILALGWSVFFAITLYFVTGADFTYETKSLYLGGLLDIQIGIKTNYFSAVLSVLLGAMGAWSLSGFNISKPSKAVLYVILNLGILGVVFFDQLIVKMIILEILITLASCCYFLPKYVLQKDFAFITNAFCLGMLLVLLVFELSGQMQIYQELANIIYLIYFIFRMGVLRELFIFSSNVRCYTAPIVDQYFSIVFISSVLTKYLNSGIWANIYYEKFTFVALVAFSGIFYFILNRTKNSAFLRISQLKYVALILTFFSLTNGNDKMLPFTQLILFFFMWELLSELDNLKGWKDKMRWFLVVLLVGPIPILPFQKTLIENLKTIYANDYLLGAVGGISVLMVLILVPSGMFKNEEVAT